MGQGRRKTYIPPELGLELGLGLGIGLGVLALAVTTTTRSGSQEVVAQRLLVCLRLVAASRFGRCQLPGVTSLVLLHCSWQEPSWNRR